MTCTGSGKHRCTARAGGMLGEGKTRWTRGRVRWWFSPFWPMVFSGIVLINKKISIYRKQMKLHFSGSRVCADGKTHLQCPQLPPGLSYHGASRLPEGTPGSRNKLWKLLPQAHVFTRVLTRSRFLYLVTYESLCTQLQAQWSYLWISFRLSSHCAYFIQLLITVLFFLMLSSKVWEEGKRVKLKGK